MPSPTGFSSFSQQWEELFYQIKFLPVVSCLGHQKVIWSEPAALTVKLFKGRVQSLMDFFLHIFLAMKISFNLNKFWY